MDESKCIKLTSVTMYVCSITVVPKEYLRSKIKYVDKINIFFIYKLREVVDLVLLRTA